MQHAWAFPIQPTNPGLAVSVDVGLSGYLSAFEEPARVLFWGVLGLFLFIYSVIMVFYSHDESAMAESKHSYSYAVAGVIVVSVATMLVNSVAPGSTNAIRSGGGAYADTALGNVITYAQLAVSIALIVNIVIQGFRLIFSGGEQEYVERARKRLIYSFIGIVLVLVSHIIVTAVDPGHGHDLKLLTAEAKGIINFILTILGISIVIALIVAGIMLVVSVDESLKGKAQTVIKTAIFTLIVILISYVLVNTFIGLRDIIP